MVEPIWVLDSPVVKNLGSVIEVVPQYSYSEYFCFLKALAKTVSAASVDPKGRINNDGTLSLDLVSVLNI
jgi:hypothetical protein